MKTIASVVLAAAVSVTAATTHAAAHRTGIARLTPAQRHAVRAAGEFAVVLGGLFGGGSDLLFQPGDVGLVAVERVA